MNTAPPIATVQVMVEYPVMEHFYTVQGEGHFTGRAAYFVRLGGCDVGCHWCDVKESWPMEAHPKVNVAELVHTALQYPARLVVVTGGEPLMHDVGPLTKAFRAAGFRTHIETSGAYPLTGEWDWICLSPKKFKAPHPSIYHQAQELKVVVYHSSDFAFAESHATLMHSSCRKYLQPEWSKADAISPQLVEYVKQHPEWHISLQTHKYLAIP